MAPKKDKNAAAAAAPAEPAPSSKKGGNKKGKRHGDDSDDDEPAPAAAAPASKGNKKGGKKAEEDEPQPAGKKGGKKAVEDEEDDEPQPKPVAAPVASKKKDKKKDKKKQQQDSDEEDEAQVDEEDQEEVEIPQPVKKDSGKKGGKAPPVSAFAALALEDEDEEIENDDEEPEPEEDEEEKEEPVKPVSSSSSSSGKSTPAPKEDKVAEDDMTEEERAALKKAKRKAKGGQMIDAFGNMSVVAMNDDTVDYSVKGGESAAKAERKAKKDRKKQAQLESDKQVDQMAKVATKTVDAILDDNEEDDGKAPLGNDIKVHKFTVFMGGKALFKDASLTLAHGHRYGLVGWNGTGKSTLLHNLASREGDFRIPKHIDILLVEQEVVADDRTALQVVIESDDIRMQLLEEEKRILALDDKGGENGERLQKIYEKLQEIGAESATARASAILSGLQFSEDMKKMGTKDFSGGWRMRISLARALFRKPRLLLLDEPTNHLDLHAVIWLENYLQSWQNTLIVVSHDRDFLNNTCTDILHVWNQKLVHYKGAYDSFYDQLQLKIQQHNEAYEKQEKRLIALKKSGKVTLDVGKVSSRDSQTKKKQRDMVVDKKGKNARADDDDDEIAGHGQIELLKPIYDYVVKLNFSAASPLNSVLVKVQNVTFNYEGRENIFEKVDFGIDSNSRIAIVGPNGTGKSTLLKLCTKEIEPVKGTVSHNAKLRIGVYSQHSVDQLDLDLTPVSYLQKVFPGQKYQDVRKLLGTIGLPGSVHEHPIRTLSGGQKSRVVLVQLQLTQAHILFLDEPTNHLDLETVDGLVEALNAFEGGVVIVTHNVSLISKACNEIWECGLDKTVEKFDGDFHDYEARLVQEMKEAETL